MHKVTFTLKQHTPLIHFLKDDGATLRVTELKPKLDKYIISTMGGIEEALLKYNPWIISKGEINYLDYQIKIVANEITTTLIPEGSDNRKPFYFGNMGELYRQDPKYFSFTDSPIIVKIRTKNTIKIDNESLIEFIMSIIKSFFLEHNFGTRQSKGYGSFYIHQEDEIYSSPHDEILEIRKAVERFLPYSFDLRIAGNSNFAKSLKALEKLEIFYKALRSGINVCYGANRHYLKSLIWLYFKDMIVPNLKWEKKIIKEQFLKKFHDQQFDDHMDEDDFEHTPLGFNGTRELLIKDLFGLASEEKWKAEYETGFEKEIENVERFKSPILFKIIPKTVDEVVVYFQSEYLESNNSILNRTVTISNANSNINSITIDTPDSFDFHNFFDYLFDSNQFVLEDYWKGSTNHPNYTIINSIVKQLQNSKQ